MIPRWIFRFVVLFLMLGSLSACGNAVEAWRAPPVVQIEKLTIPDSMLHCVAKPAVPDDSADQAAFGMWAVQEKAADLDCRAKLDAIGKLQADDLTKPVK